MTDDELNRFADSAEGRACIAKARHLQGLAQRHHGPDAAPFTDALERQAIRDGMAKQAREAVASEAFKQSALVRQLDEISARRVRDAVRDGRFRHA
jgi:hypothetical protein